MIFTCISYHKRWLTITVNAEISIPEQWSINSQSFYLLSLPRVNRSCTCEWNMHVNAPLLVNGWTEPPSDIGHSMCERDYSPWQCLKACNTMPFHIPWHTSPGHTIYHVMSARPYHISYRAHQAIPYTIPCPPGHTIYHAMPARPYYILCQAPCLACQAITIYHAMLARTYHSPCDACHAIPYTIWCPPGHTIYHAMRIRPYHIPCPLGRTIYHAMPARLYHKPWHALKVIPYNMPCPPGHTI